MPLKLKKVSSKDGKTYTWHITGSVQGHRCRESTGTDCKATAERILNQRNREILDAGTLGHKHGFTVAETFLYYLEHGGEARFIGPLNEAFGHIRVNDLTAKHLSDYVAAKLPGRSGSYVKRIVYAPINVAINAAAKADLCDYRKFQAPAFKMARRPNAPDGWIEEMLELVNPRLRALMLFTTYTGARIGEACAITGDDIDMSQGRVMINATKTETQRWVKMHPDIVEALQQIDIEPGQRVFGYAGKDSVNTAIERICKRHEIDYYSSHQWGRKAFATRHLVKGDKTLKWIKEAGGWQTMRMVEEHYAHLEQSIVDEGIVSVNLRKEDKK